MPREQRLGKVAHILPFPAVGGTEMATRRVAEAAGEYGFESTMFHRPEATPVEALFAGDFETAIFEPVVPSYRSPRAFVANSFRLARQLRQKGITLVHCADILGAIFAGHAARLAGIPLLCHVRNRYTELSLRDRSFLLPVQKFAFVSGDTRAKFAYPIRERRGVVLYDGLDVAGDGPRLDERASVREEFGIPADAPVIGMVARVAAQKDFPTLVRAAARVVGSFPKTRFLIVGDCSSTEANRTHLREVQSRIDALGLQPHFIFTDFRRDVPRIMSAVDIFVLSTHWEGLPLVLLEAMAYGLPVVATAVDGVPEIVLHERTGLLHDHADDAQLAERLCSLLGAPEGARFLGNMARSHVAEHFSREAFAARLARLYAEMHRMDPMVVASTHAAGTAPVLVGAS